jgi:hypothetical protein
MQIVVTIKDINYIEYFRLIKFLRGMRCAFLELKSILLHTTRIISTLYSIKSHLILSTVYAPYG